MAYNQTKLDAYRALYADSTADTQRVHDLRHPTGAPAYTRSSFRSRTCPYCTGVKDPTVKYTHPNTKPDSPWAFWKNIIVEKYRALQSEKGRANMAREVPVKAAAQPSDAATGSRAGRSDKMFVVGPMVDQSELPFRLLCRQYGATLTYTPMLHAKLFRDGLGYRTHYLTTTSCAEVQAALARANVATRAEDETPASIPQLIDRPVIVQFCGNDAEVVLEAARLALYEETSDGTVRTGARQTKAHVDTPSGDAVRTPSSSIHDTAPLYRCDAVDLNLGCPQGIAKRGHYGSFLMEDWEAIHTIIHTLHVELEVPVTAKIRVFDRPAAVLSDGHGAHSQASTHTLDPDTVCYDEALTIEYARMVRDAGAQLICVHGRTRAMKGQHSGLANMALIGRVRDALEGSVPVLANGNVLDFADVLSHLESTQCEGHMCAEPLLWEPRLFADVPDAVRNGRVFGANKTARLAALDAAVAYLGWVRRHPVDLGFVKTHLFKMCHHSYELHCGFRDELGRWGTARDDDAPVGSCGEQRASTSREDLAWTEEAASTPTGDVASDFEAQMAALDSHIRALREAERACDVEGEQPKTAHAEKQRARDAIKDVFDTDEGDVGFGLLF